MSGSGIRIALILLSAGMHALPFAPFNLTGFAWFALVPFLLALRGLRPLAAAFAGLLWGTAAMWGVGYWVPSAFAFYYQQPLWFGFLFAFGASVVFAGSYFAGFAACASWAAARTKGVSRATLLSVLWVAWELARARLLTGDPWLLLGYSLVPRPTLIQAADLGGVYLLSFVIVFANASLCEAILTRQRSPRATAAKLAPAGLLVAAVCAYGLHRLATPLPAGAAARVTIVQGNNDFGSQWQRDFYGRGLKRYLRLTYGAASKRPPEVIIWPESALTFFLAHEPVYQAVIARTLAATGADLIVGGPHHDSDPTHPHYFNSAFYLTSGGQLTGRYDKSHLLPFAEYFPLRTIELLRRRFERVRYFTPGEPGALLDTRLGKVAIAICFEGIFPDLVRRQMASGARLFVNLSNDAWLGSGAGPEQHLSMVTLRAVENRTWVIRATTTGVSAVIDPFGRIRSRTETFTPAVLEEEVVPLRVPTVYKRGGDAFAYGCVLVSILAFLVLAGGRPGRKSERA